MQKPVSDFRGNLVPFLNRKLRTYGYIQLRMKPVPQPSHTYFSDIANPRGVINRMVYFINNLRVDPIQQAVKIDLPDSHTIRKIAAVISRPTTGSANG